MVQKRSAIVSSCVPGGLAEARLNWSQAVRS